MISIFGRSQRKMYKERAILLNNIFQPISGLRLINKLIAKYLMHYLMRCNDVQFVNVKGTKKYRYHQNNV
jgi:hypothetical protein